MNGFSACLLAMWTPGPFELVVIGIVALLIFGRRLPSAAYGFGRSFVEFRRGVSEIKGTKVELLDDVRKATELGKYESDDPSRK